MRFGYQNWSGESLMQVYNDYDLHGGQRSSDDKCGILCAMVTKLGQKNPWCKFIHDDDLHGQRNPWCKFIMIMTFMEVKGHQRTNVVNFALWLPNLVRRSLMTKMTCIEVKGQQRSNVVIYVIWLPHLVRYTANTSYGWWWPSWRLNVIQG